MTISNITLYPIYYYQCMTISNIILYIQYVTISHLLQPLKSGVFAPLNAREEAKKSILQKTAQ